MPLQVNIGATVAALIDGHSATNGAPIPDGATIALTSSDPTVATVPATVPVPAGGAKEIVAPVTLVGTVAGSTTISCVVTVGTLTFPASDSLLVAVPAPGLTHVTLTLVSPAP